VIHGDGLDNFSKSKHYTGILSRKGKDLSPDKRENPVFDFVISNPPYSVGAFKVMVQNAINAYGEWEHSFEMFDQISDASSEIESLFVERTKQLLRDGGVAALILPSSILSNSSYTKVRSIFLRYFEFIGITELGSNTFMATGTNTVILFLRRRNNNDSLWIQTGIQKFFQDGQFINVQVDYIRNKVLEDPFGKYISYVWEWIEKSDYITLIEKKPNDAIRTHEIYQTYLKKIAGKTENEKWKNILDLEREKMLTYLLAYGQEVVIVKTGEKDAEKKFLGYEFSDRRGNEGIHSIPKWKPIDECTRLFDPTGYDNPERASTYMRYAFYGEFERAIDPSLTDNVSRIPLVDMMTWDREVYDMSIKTSVKKKIKIGSDKWEMVKLGEVTSIVTGKKDANFWTNDWKYPFFTCGEKILMAPDYSFDTEAILIAGNGNVGECKYYKGKFEVYQRTYVIDWFRWMHPRYCFYILSTYLPEHARNLVQWSTMPYITMWTLTDFHIPLPPLDFQQQIVNEIEILEKREVQVSWEISTLRRKIDTLISESDGSKKIKIGEIAEELFAWWDLPEWNYIKWGTPNHEYTIPIFSNGLENEGLYWFTNIARVNRPCITISARWTIWYPIERKISFYPIVRLLVLIPRWDFALNKYLVEVIKKLDLNQFWATTPQLTVPQISDFKIPLPPLAEQQRIVTEIEQIEWEITQLEAELANIPAQKEAILKKYL
jgi:type I restriction enzyme M protein